MDGEATGILGALPKFQRRSETVPRVRSSIAGKQYLMLDPKNQGFGEFMLLAAKKNGCSDTFQVNARQKNLQALSMCTTELF